MRELDVQLAQLLPIIRDQLDSGRTVSFSPRGTSMLPMLRQGMDRVTLSPISGGLKKYDLPLYRLDSGKFVLHRIVDAGECYTCRGDNTYRDETGLRRDQMIGVVTSFTRGKRVVSVKNPGYRLYCRVWVAAYPLRRFVRRVLGWVKRRWMRHDR